ncbi:hypothetical protein B0H19DRAFT_240116 [Mycena capillaripes]|nr:hypothetical protein B0H19DRAFT_240116 [Mycena capillaripes]
MLFPSLERLSLMVDRLQTTEIIDFLCLLPLLTDLELARESMLPLASETDPTDIPNVPALGFLPRFYACSLPQPPPTSAVPFPGPHRPYSPRIHSGTHRSRGRICCASRARRCPSDP